MPDVVRAVDRLAQRAQHHHLQQLLVRPVLDLVDQLGIVLGVGFVATAELLAEGGEEVAQLGQPLRRRSFVDAIERRMFAFLEKIRGADVGGQHALFDDAMRVVAFVGFDAGNLALVVEHHACFDGLEIDGATLFPRLGEHAVERVEVFQIRQQAADLLQRCRVLVVKRRGDFGVGQPRMRPYDRRIEAILLDRASRGNVHVADHAQALDLRVQRTQSVRELFRQHRNHAAREIHRVATQPPLGVECAAIRHVMRDIGNRHHQPVTLALPLAEHGVVEVLGRFAVDGDKRQFGQVLAALPVRLAYDIGQFLRFRLGLFREVERQLMLAQRDLDFQAGIGVGAEDLDDPPDRLRLLRRLLDDLDHHHLAGFCAQGFPIALFRRGDQDVLADALVFGDDVIDAVFLEDTTDDLPVGAFGDLDDLALGPPLAIHARHTGNRMVAVQHLGHFLFGQEQVGTPMFTWLAHEEAEAVRMPLHPAAHQVGLVGNQPVVAPVLQQLGLARHRAEATAERLVLEIGNVEQLAQAFECNRHALLGQNLQDVFTAWQRMVVIRALALDHRIGGADLRELAALG